MKLYVAGCHHERSRIASEMERFRAAGHHVTHDWTRVDADNPPAGGDKNRLARDAFLADVKGVRRAEAVVLFVDLRSVGAWIEFGVALERRLPIVLVNPEGHWRPAFHLPLVWQVADADGALALLSQWAPEAA